MTPDQIEQVFGRGRLKMATGQHVEVFREAMASGERRRYTKRFLATIDGDFGPWTEREWRILARLIGHGIRCVPDVVQFDGGALGGARLVQTYDAGITVDQWGTLLQVTRSGETYRQIFEDCAHWWALAHHCLAALDEIHALGLVHLDIKGDNICIPYAPADFDPYAPSNRLRPQFAHLALIDFAFSLVSRESLAMALPIGWQKDYDYQSPRLLRALDAGRDGDLEPTKDLDWRCDLYSLAAMLKRYLPADGRASGNVPGSNWNQTRYDEARTLILRLRESHDRDLPHWRPHRQFMDYTWTRLEARDLTASLAEGWALARNTVAAGIATPLTSITPMTRIAPVTARRAGTVIRSSPATIGEATQSTAPLAFELAWRPASPIGAATAITAVTGNEEQRGARLEPPSMPQRAAQRVARRTLPASVAVASLIAIAVPSFVGDPDHPLADRMRELDTTVRLPFDRPAQDVLRQPNGAPPVADSGRESAADASATARFGNPAHEAAPARSALPEPVADMTPGHADASAYAPPTQAEPDAAPRIEPGGTAARKLSPQDSEVPSGNDARVAAIAGAGSVPLRSKATAAKRLAVLKPGIAANRAPQANRSSPASAKATNDLAKTYADAAQRPTVHASSAPRAGVATPRTRVELASARSTPSSRPSSMQPAARAAGSPGNEGVALSTALPAAGSSAPSETPSTNVPVEGALPNATAAPPTPPGGSVPEASPPSIARSDSPASSRMVARAKPHDSWPAQLAGLFSLFRDRDGPAAPVEDRAAQASGSRQVLPSRAPAADGRSRAALASSVAGATPPVQVDIPRPAAPALVTTESPAQTSGTPATIASRYADAHTQGGPTAEAVVTAPSPPQLSPSVRNAPPLAAPPATRSATAPRYYQSDESRDFAAQGRRLLEDAVPRVAAQAEPEVSRVLSTAAIAYHPAQARFVIDAADGPWSSESEWIQAAETIPGYARWLHNEARRAGASGGDISKTLNIELMAFGANPRDPDIAGYLAILYLRINPARPETARQLALHAIVVSGSKRSSRYAEWSTFAVASALTGRDADAVRAFLAEAALSPNVDRSCQSALRAYANYGQRLRAPVLALLQRVNAQGRAYDAPSCMWPAYWNAAARAGGTY